MFKKTLICKLSLKFLRYVLLLMMKSKLKRYKRDSLWYHKQGAQPNWYDEQGIPDLQKDITMLEETIRIERG